MLLVDQLLVELGEPKVVADCHADAPSRRFAGHQLASWGRETALKQQRSVWDVHVEQVHLGVRCSDYPGRVDHHVGVEAMSEQQADMPQSNSGEAIQLN